MQVEPTRSRVTLLVALVLASLIATEAAAAQAGPQGDGIQGPPEAVARAHALVEAMGGAYLWSELRSLHQRMVQAYVGAPDRVVEDEHLDLAELRTRFELRSEIYLQRRAASPDGSWIERNGELREHGPEELAGSLRAAAGNMYRIVRRVARGDPELAVRFAEGSEHRLEFLDREGSVLCWIVVDVIGEPVAWGRSDVEWVFGPLVRFGNIRVPGWGAYTSGDWRYELIEAEASRDPPAVSFAPPSRVVGSGGGSSR